jgi:hypothetical protein
MATCVNVVMFLNSLASAVHTALTDLNLMCVHNRFSGFKWTYTASGKPAAMETSVRVCECARRFAHSLSYPPAAPPHAPHTPTHTHTHTHTFVHTHLAVSEGLDVGVSTARRFLVLPISTHAVTCIHALATNNTDTRSRTLIPSQQTTSRHPPTLRTLHHTLHHTTRHGTTQHSKTMHLAWLCLLRASPRGSRRPHLRVGTLTISFRAFLRSRWRNCQIHPVASSRFKEVCLPCHHHHPPTHAPTTITVTAFFPVHHHHHYPPPPSPPPQPLPTHTRTHPPSRPQFFFFHFS